MTLRTKNEVMETNDTEESQDNLYEDAEDVQPEP